MHVHSCTKKFHGSTPRADKLYSGFQPSGVGEMRSRMYVVGDCYLRLQSWRAQRSDGHMWIMQPEAQTTTRGSLAVSMDILEKVL